MRSSSGRKIYNPETHHKTTQIAVSDITREENAKKRAIANLIRHNSPEEKICQTARDIPQQLDKTKQLVVAALNNVVVTIEKDILNLVSAELNSTQKSKKRDGYMQPSVSFEHIQELVNDFIPLFI